MAIRGVFDVVDGAFGLATTETGGGAAAAGGEWVRNKAWPELTEPTAGEQKVVGLYAVFPGDSAGLGNYFSMLCRGAYTVDYGDGSAAVNVADNTRLDYTYDFDDTDLYDATVTLTDAGDLVTRNDHGYSDGDRIQLYRIAGTTGVSEGQSYYVISSTANTFQLSLTEGGSAVTLTTNGTAALLPYKIATVTITPQGGSNLTTVQFNQVHPSAANTSGCGWLDLAIAGGNITTLAIGRSGVAMGSYLLERCQILSLGAITSMASLFNECRSLQDVSLPFSATASVTNMSLMFSGCHMLKTAPPMNTSAVTTSMASMFLNCYSLENVPIYDTALVTSMASMFNACSSLRSVPFFNTASCTNFGSMLAGCYRLTTFPQFDTNQATLMANMFSNCFSLSEVPAISCAGVTSSGQMPAPVECKSLKRYLVTDINYSINLSNALMLTATALNEIYTNLPTVIGQTITVTGLAAAGSDDPTIASAKGWSVTG